MIRKWLALAGAAMVGVLGAPTSSWSAWGSRGVILCPAPGAQGYLRSVNGHQDDIFVVWYDTRPEPGEAFPAHVYATRVTSSGDIASGWPASGLRLDFATIANPACAAPDGEGGLFVCWSDVVVGGPQRLRLCRITAEGTVVVGSPEGGLLLGPPGRTSSTPSAMLDIDGGLLIAVAFGGEQGSSGGILVSKHDRTGATWPGWPENGVVLCDQPGTQGFPQMVPGPGGGALVVWIDHRDALDNALYGHRIHGDGTLDPAWPAQGRRLQKQAAGLPDLTAIPDGAGGMIFSNSDSMGVVDSTGTRRTGWLPAGARSEGSPPRFASDGSPGAYVLSRRIVRQYSPTNNNIQGAILGRYELSGPASPAWPDTGRVLYEGTVGQGQQPIELLASPQGIYAMWVDDGEPRGLRGLRLTPDGQVAPGWQGAPVVTTIGFGGYASTLLASGDAVIAWSGTTYNGTNTSNEDTLFVQRLGVDGPVPTLASVVAAEVRGDVATLEWLVVDAPSTPLRVERSADGVAWEPAGVAEVIGGDRVRFSEGGLLPGERRAYRLAWSEAGAQRSAGLVWVERAASEALRFVSGHLARDPQRIVFTLALPSREPVTVRVMDVQGRVEFEQRLVPGEPGVRAFEMAPHRWTAGLYLVRVRQGRDTTTGRVVVIR